VDAAVFFSDIIVPLPRRRGRRDRRGAVPSSATVRTAAEIAALVRIDPALVEERGEAVVEAVQRTSAMLAEEGERRGEPLPLIGFAGAPFTLAAYLVEGGPSKDHLGARSLIHSDPAAWADLTAWLAEVTGRFLALQVRRARAPRSCSTRGPGARAHRLPARRAPGIRGCAGARSRRAQRGPRRTSHPFRRRHR
jgi:uroporphyrinogen decarboxylase